MPLIVEIYNHSINQIGGCPEGLYNYLVKVNRVVIASGEVKHDRNTHWSVLLKKIAEDGQRRELQRVISK